MYKVDTVNVRAQSPLRICLYVAVSPEMEYRPMPVAPMGRVKRSVGRILDVLRWFLLGSAKVRFHHWGTLDVTNKGDIAIRESVKEQLKEAFAPREVVFTQLGWGSLDASLAPQIDRSHDFFVIAGSGYIFSDENGDIHPRALGECAFLEALNCPKIAYGIGWNKLLETGNLREERTLSSKAKDTLKGILGRLDLISVRDRATQDLVREITGRDAFLTGDPALFYRGAAQARPPRRDGGRLHVGVNFAMHGKESMERVARQHVHFCKFLRDFARQHRVTYYYMQHTHTERVFPLLLLSRGIVVRLRNPPVEHLLGTYEQLDLNFCQMLHSAILATNAGVPTLQYAYDVKSIGFFELMQLPQFCFPDWPFDPNAALSAAENLLAQNAAIKVHIAQRKEYLRKILDAFLLDIRLLASNEVTSR